jgi:hypothetical protein
VSAGGEPEPTVGQAPEPQGPPEIIPEKITANTKTLWRRIRPYARIVFALVAVGIVVWVLTDHSAELAGASGYLTQIRWGWLALASVAEFGSIIAYARVQQKLLQAGRVRVPLGWMTDVTLANIAMTNSLPAGTVVATVFTYRQYRNKGADEVLAGWTIIALLVVTSVTLALVASAGVGVAGSESSNNDLVGVTIAILAVTLIVAALFIQRLALLWIIARVALIVRKVLPNLRRHPDVWIQLLGERLSAVTWTPRQMVVSLAWGMCNWILDCGCLVLSFAALGVDVPWRGLLLAYGAGQLAANLPITPGGLGVVEGSLTVALVAYGGAETSTVAAVFLYRLISFWGELPVGWGAWFWLARRRRKEHVPSDSVIEEALAEHQEMSQL